MQLRGSVAYSFNTCQQSELAPKHFHCRNNENILPHTHYLLLNSKCFFPPKSFRLIFCNPAAFSDKDLCQQFLTRKKQPVDMENTFEH